MPIWVPPTGEFAGLHNGNVKAALREGLTCRPIEETVADTWAWLQLEGDPPQREDRPQHGISPGREAAALAAAEARRRLSRAQPTAASQPRTAASQATGASRQPRWPTPARTHRRRAQRGTGHRPRVLGRHERVLGPADDEHRDLAPRQHVEGVRPAAMARCAQATVAGAAAATRPSRTRTQVGVPRLRSAPSSLGSSSSCSTRTEPSASTRTAMRTRLSRAAGWSALALVLDRTRPTDPVGVPAQDGQGDVAAHRRAADDRALDAVGVQQGDHVVGHDVERGWVVAERRRGRTLACRA